MNHFIFVLNLEIPEITILGFEIPNIKLFGVEVEIFLSLLNNFTLFELDVRLKIEILDETFDLKFNF